jgi:hypothetical protein
MMKFVNQLLHQHVERYPALQLVDIYKLLHQAALGPGHAVKDAAMALDRLKKEVAALGPPANEPEQEVISPDGRLARIHLRPYVAAGKNVEDLHRAFVETANTYPASAEKLAKFCGCLGDLAGAGGIPFPQNKVVEFFERIAQSGYPVMHHSPEYTAAYRPAYRVVAIELLNQK